MNALHDETVVVVLHGQDALQPEDVRAEPHSHVLDPWHELMGVHRRVAQKRKTSDRVVVVMVVEVVEKVRLDFEHPVEAEGALPDHLVEVHRAAGRTMDFGVGIDAPDTGLDLDETCFVHEVGLVEQDHVGEG